MNQIECKAENCRMTVPKDKLDLWSMPCPLCIHHDGVSCYSCGKLKGNSIKWKKLCIDCYKKSIPKEFKKENTNRYQKNLFLKTK
jgi:hypothetical protein